MGVLSHFHPLVAEDPVRPRDGLKVVGYRVKRPVFGSTQTLASEDFTIYRCSPIIGIDQYKTRFGLPASSVVRLTHVFSRIGKRH
jgi:hypothetical protein